MNNNNGDCNMDNGDGSSHANNPVDNFIINASRHDDYISNDVDIKK